MGVQLRVSGLEELRAKFRRAPRKFDDTLKSTMQASLLTLQENVPPYPAAKADSTYVRTGTLGRTLGAGGGKADIYTVKSQGNGMYSAEFGTRLKYAPYVIGEREQAWMHKSRWWTIRTIAERARPKIERLFGTAVKLLCEWLNQNGG